MKISIVPFYGGASGQSLQIIETEDGKTITQIIETPTITKVPLPSKEEEEEEGNVERVEYPQLPTKNENGYTDGIRAIHESAANVLRLQEEAEKSGRLSAAQREEYTGHVETLNASGRRLALLQDPDEEDDVLFADEALTAWFNRKKEKKKTETKDKEDGDKKKEEQKEKEKEKEKPEVTKKPPKGEEEREEEGDDNESVVINVPPDDASVAEAKPVGLAVAGKNHAELEFTRSASMKCEFFSKKTLNSGE